MEPVLCIYHGNCADGFTAAWVVRCWATGTLGREIEFHAGVYGNPPPDVTGRDVFIVDFSYKRDVMLAMANTARRITVLDHHKSAEAELCDIATESNFKIHAVFDMERSGARIAWDYFFPMTAPPALLLHVEDRDLWRFKLPSTREIQASLFSYPYDFDVWDRLMEGPVVDLVSDGVAIERKHHKDVGELVEVTTRLMLIGGNYVPVANLPYTLVSDAAHLLAARTPYGYAGCYWDTPTGRVFGLRSLPGGPDVSEIAKRYGGGGHANAAGFRLSHAEAAAMPAVVWEPQVAVTEAGLSSLSPAPVQA